MERGASNSFLFFWLQVDIKPLRDATAIAVPAPKIAVKRKAEDADASKDLKKVSVLAIRSLAWARARAGCVLARRLAATRRKPSKKIAFQLGTKRLYFKEGYQVAGYIRVISIYELCSLSLSLPPLWQPRAT